MSSISSSSSSSSPMMISTTRPKKSKHRSSSSSSSSSSSKLFSRTYIMIALVILILLITILLLHSHQNQELGLSSRITSLRGKASELVSTVQAKQKHLNEALAHGKMTNPSDDDDTASATVTTTTATNLSNKQFMQSNSYDGKKESSTKHVDITDIKSSAFPGGAKHPILLLDDDTFHSTSLKTMMSWYNSDPSGTCDYDFGNKLVERWSSTKKSYCSSSSSSSSSSNSNSLGSSIDCFLVSQTRHAGNGDNLCHMKNVAVNVGYFGNDDKMNAVVENYVRTSHNQQPYVKFPRGFIKADCHVDNELWQSKYMPGWNADLTVEAVDTNPSSPYTTSVCDEWIDEPVMIMQRDTFANFFHDSEDFFDIFLGMAVLDWSKKDTQIFLTDLDPRGPFWDLWDKVFASNDKKRPTMTSWDLKLKYCSNVKKSVCFIDFAIGIYGPAAPITVASWDTPCHSPGTALVKAYSDYVIRGLGLHHLTHYKESKPSKTIVITYLARRSSSEWPEKRYCDSKNSFFRCELWESFGIRKLGRVIKNDNEVVQALKELESESFNNGATVKFQDVDFNLLSFEDQIKVDLQTDILIGPHGAGLMHNIFMRDRAILVELSIDGSSANRHFHNLANWYGRQYYDLIPSNPVNTMNLKAKIREAISQININHY